MQTITQNETSASLRRVLFVAELAANTNEVQRIDLGDISTADTFTLSFNGQTTASITYNATPATFATNIDTALENLSNIGAGEVTVAHVSGNIFTATFSGALAATAFPLITINSPTTFTPGLVTKTTYGGVLGAPALGYTFVPSNIKVSKNGAAAVDSLGTVTEVGDGRYYYEATAGEVDTLGFLSFMVVLSNVSSVFPTCQIIAASGSTLGAPVIRSGTAQAGTSSTITLDTGASGVSGYYTPAIVYIRSNEGAGQARFIFAYNGSTKVASVEPDWAVAPNNTSVFDILPVSPLIVDLLRTNHTVINTFGEVATPGDVALATKTELLLDDTSFNGADITSLAGRVPTALVNGRMVADATAIDGSATAAAQLRTHTLTVLNALLTTGSTTTTLNLNTSTGINGAVPSAANDFYNGRVIVFITGALAGQARAISDYNGSTKILTISEATTSAAASGDTAVIV